MPGLVAGLDALIVATGLLFAMFLVSSVLRPLLVAVLSGAPFVGGWLASNVDAGLARFQSNIRRPAEASIGLLAAALQWIAYHATEYLNASRALANGLVNGLWRLANVTLPHGLAATLAHASAQLAAARADLLLGIQRAEALAKAGEAAVLSTATAEVRAARSEAQGLFKAAEVEAGQLAGRAEATAHNLFLQAEVDAGQLVGAAIVDAERLVDAERRFAAAGLLTVETELRRVEQAAGVALADTAAVLGADIASAETRAANAAQQLAAPIEASVQAILDSVPWSVLAATVNAGEAMLRADVEMLVKLGLKTIRQEIGDAEAIRAKYGPAVASALASLRTPN